MPRLPDPQRQVQPPIHGCTCGRLRRLTRRITAVYDHALAPCGLRVTQFSLMSGLLKLQAPTLAELAETMDMERTTLLRNLRPLVAAGWVRVEARAHSRRREARLTPAGHAKWTQARRFWRVAQSAVNSTLGESEVARLHQRLDRYLSQLRSPVEKE
ncbi:MAG TPA: MarR family winged helix-turn-helix transcriptional regulator [Burkholderiaceae bacterium]|jgi:DNA-binding MarR family transcriptional regulator|nr:MarR family winged helix-turn-helix transcriptional regulator [Burkholderiaceae bacterium]